LNICQQMLMLYVFDILSCVSYQIQFENKSFLTLLGFNTDYKCLVDSLW